MSDQPPPYLEVYLVFSILIACWELYLDVRQFRKNLEKDRPEELKDIVPAERFEKSQLYQADNLRFKMFSKVVGLITNTFEVIYIWPWVWNYTKSVVGENEYSRSILWQILTSMVGMPISIPMDLYHDFVIEERHGFNKKTIKLFFMDLIKQSLLGVVLCVLLVPVFIAVIRWGGEHFYLYIWLVAQTLIFVFMFIYPTLIMPMFNKYEPLQDQELKKRIEDLASGLNYPLSKLFQMNGSIRSSHSNAYLFGFWKNKRIVLFDTLLQTMANLTVEAGAELGAEMTLETDKMRLSALKSGTETAIGKWNEVHKGRFDELKDGDNVVALRFDGKTEDTKMSSEVKEELDKWLAEGKGGSICLILERKPYTTDEILAVLCHEIGHWFHSHVLRMLIFNSVHIFCIFRLYGFAMYSGPLFQSFGFSREERSIMIGLSIFTLMFSPVEVVVSMVMTLLVRTNEYQADDFAVKQKRSTELGTCLQKLCLENLGDLNPDPWYSWFRHSHPPLVERLRNLREKGALLDKKSQ